MKNPILATLPATILLLSACGTKDQSSKLDWAHNSWAQIAVLNRVGPEDTIGLCGTEQDLTKQAIEIWAAQIGRKGKLKYVGCRERSTIKVNTKFDPAIDAGGLAWADVGDIKVKYAPPTHDYKAVLLHEVGHLWGLCDQYGDHCLNATYRSHGANTRYRSVMGSNYELKLAPDDIQGIRKMASRRDIPVNAQWLAALKPAPATNPDPKTNPPTPTSPGTSDTGSTHVPANGKIAIVKGATGQVTYRITYPEAKAEVRVFAETNGIQNVATEVSQKDGFTYSYTQSGLEPGDKVQVRFYSFSEQAGQIFSPGPVEDDWSEVFTY